MAARITQRGLEVLAELDEPVARMHRIQLSHMSRRELAQLAALLERARREDQG